MLAARTQCPRSPHHTDRLGKGGAACCLLPACCLGLHRPWPNPRVCFAAGAIYPLMPDADRPGLQKVCFGLRAREAFGCGLLPAPHTPPTPPTPPLTCTGACSAQGKGARSPGARKISQVDLSETIPAGWATPPPKPQSLKASSKRQARPSRSPKIAGWFSAPSIFFHFHSTADDCLSQCTCTRPQVSPRYLRSIIPAPDVLFWSSQSPGPTRMPSRPLAAGRPGQPRDGRLPSVLTR
jgi:hypothetical protein